MLGVSESTIRWVQTRYLTQGGTLHIWVRLPFNFGSRQLFVRESSSAIRYIQTTVMAQVTAINRNITPITKVIYHEIVPVITFMLQSNNCDRIVP